jgi:hypothetical protein
MDMRDQSEALWKRVGVLYGVMIALIVASPRHGRNQMGATASLAEALERWICPRFRSRTRSADLARRGTLRQNVYMPGSQPGLTE